jgi:Transcription elongation factor, N-terminal
MDGDAARHIFREGLAALEAELRELETESRRAIADRIRTAREWGDLKENAEYHDAKEAQAHLETKILRLRELRYQAVGVEPGVGRRDRPGRRRRDLDFEVPGGSLDGIEHRAERRVWLVTRAAADS